MVVTASDGEEGLRMAQERKPDLVVLDMLLPKLSGPEVLRALQKHARTATIPVMVLTSLPQCNRAEADRGGSNLVFRKVGIDGG